MSSVLKIAGGVVSAFGAIDQGKQEKAAAYYNADVLNERAREEETKASIIADNIRRAKRLTGGKQVARYGKAGVKVFSGSSLKVLADTAAQYDRDLAINNYNKNVAVTGLQTQASYSKKRGQAAMRAAYTKAFASLLQSGSEVQIPSFSTSTNLGGSSVSSPDTSNFWGAESPMTIPSM